MVKKEENTFLERQSLKRLKEMEENTERLYNDHLAHARRLKKELNSIKQVIHSKESDAKLKEAEKRIAELEAQIKRK